MSNCLFEAAFENILERCRCAPGRDRGELIVRPPEAGESDGVSGLHGG